MSYCTDGKKDSHIKCKDCIQRILQLSIHIFKIKYK